MATLNFNGPFVYFFYPYTLGPGQTAEIGIVYYSGNVASFLTVETSTALNVDFTIQNTIVTTHGASEDSPPTDTTYLITVTNGDPINTVEFAVQSLTVFT